MKEDLAVCYPLVNFESDVDEIPLSDYMLIKKVTTRRGPIEIVGMSIPETVTTEWGAKIKGNSSEDIRNKAFVLIYGLRLFKTGPVGFDDYYFHSELSPPNLSKEEIPNLWFLKPDLEVSGTYSLVRSEVKHVRSFFDKFLSIESIDSNLKIALHRFNRGIQSGSVEERFLDFITTLEVILSDGPGGIRYKLANRVASLVGSKENSFRVYKDVSDLYNLRSKTLHSGRVDYKKLSLKISLLESLVRRSLLSALALKQRFPQWKLPGKLDECLHNHQAKVKLQSEVSRFWEGIKFPVHPTPTKAKEQ